MENLREAVQWLLDNGYGVMVSGQFVPTQKLNNELGGGDEIVIPLRVATISNPSDRKELWNKFIADAEIPHRVTSPNGTGQYTVRQYSEVAVKALVKIVNDPSINYERLVASTKHYYKTVSYKQILSNYLVNGTWKHEYDEYKPENKAVQNNDGSNRWES